jgi:hypothetical protein
VPDLVETHVGVIGEVELRGRTHIRYLGYVSDKRQAARFAAGADAQPAGHR